MMKRSDLKISVKNYFLKPYNHQKDLRKNASIFYFLFSLVLLDFLHPLLSPNFSLIWSVTYLSYVLAQRLASFLKIFLINI